MSSFPSDIFPTDAVTHSPSAEPISSDTEHLARIVAIQNEVATARLDLDELMHLIAERTQSLTGADGAAFELLEGEEMVYRAASGTAVPFIGLRLKARESLSGRCVLTRTALVCEDSEEDSRVDREACRRVGARSMIVVPLPHSTQIVGVLKVMSARPNAFQTRDRQALEMMASLLGAMANHAALIKEQTEKVRRTETLYRTIVDNANEGIWTVDAEMRTTFVNKRFADILGYRVDEILGQTPDLLMFDEDKEIVQIRQAARRAGESDIADMRFRCKDGSSAWFLVSANPLTDGGGNHIGSMALLTDITARKRLEEQLLQAQKLESVGRLAGGIAHDFNNLLTVILGNADLASCIVETSETSQTDSATASNAYPQQGEKSQADSALLIQGEDRHLLEGYLDNIIQASERAANLTGQLLAFARRKITEHRIIDINALIRDLESILRRLIGENMELSLLLQANLPTVKIDPSQLEQILVNLVVNARDAMPQGGQITLETHTANLDEEYAEQHPGVVPGDYVCLSVSDTGTGMDEAIRLHIFEPFFTTKEQGRGTGLGLATVYGIVKQAAGHIWIYSEMGMGTTFKIYLPHSTLSAVAVPLTPSAVPVVGGTETLLLVEDEAAVRELIVKSLRRYGYTVLEARNGAEALEIVDTYAGQIALLVTDVVMPRMSGADLTERVKQGHPDIRVLYASGYTDNTIIQHGVLEPGFAFLAKPFTPTKLARKVREVLDASN